MTEKLFYENSYLKQNTSKIIDITEINGKFDVVLDSTIFYPEGGGQPCDKGTIDSILIKNVFEKEGIVHHILDEKPRNEEVLCILDFETRFDHMQQHSGEHLLSGAFFSLYNGMNNSFHIGEDFVHIDIDIKEIDERMLEKVENKANSYIYRNISVDSFIATKDQSLTLPMRKKATVDSNIRIIQFGKADCCACCGTHVSRSGEIGIIKIFKTEKNKGMTRVYFKCGKRAFEDIREKVHNVNEIGRFFSCKESDIFKRVENQYFEMEELKRELESLKQKFTKIQIEELKKKANSKLIVEKFFDKDMKDLQIISSLMEKEDYILILASLKENKLIFAHGGNYNIDCGQIFKDYAKAFNGRGGGNINRAQGAFSSSEDILEFIAFLENVSKKMIE